MPRGGARFNSGPAPDPNALRRDRPSDKDGWTTLPAGGFTGKIPPWPLIPDVVTGAKRDIAQQALDLYEIELNAGPDARRRNKIVRESDQLRIQVTVLGRQIDAQVQLETELWDSIWRTPQAAAWATLGWSRDVAQYVRHKVSGELGSLDHAKEARQWSDRLGLNPTAMLRNRWRISADEVAPKRAARTPVKRSSMKDRLKALDGGAS